jgi:hypothetical protein
MKPEDCGFGVKYRVLPIGYDKWECKILRKDTCPDTCPIVKLIEESKWARFEINAMHGEIATLKEGEDCPDCGNQGGWKYSATPCRWCHGNPNSKFNRARWKK